MAIVKLMDFQQSPPRAIISIAENPDVEGSVGICIFWARDVIDGRRDRNALDDGFDLRITVDDKETWTWSLAPIKEAA